MFDYTSKTFRGKVKSFRNVNQIFKYNFLNVNANSYFVFY